MSDLVLEKYLIIFLRGKQRSWLLRGMVGSWGEGEEGKWERTLFGCGSAQAKVRGLQCQKKRILEGARLPFLGVAWLWGRELLRKSHLLMGEERRGPGDSGIQLAPSLSEPRDEKGQAAILPDQTQEGGPGSVAFWSRFSDNLVFPYRPGTEEGLKKPPGHPQFKIKGKLQKG